MNVIITDRHDNMIFPLQQFIKHGSGLWYTMPVVDDKHSDELVFSNFDYPLYLHPYMELRVWFGEGRTGPRAITKAGCVLMSSPTSSET